MSLLVDSGVRENTMQITLVDCTHFERKLGRASGHLIDVVSVSSVVDLSFVEAIRHV